MRRASVIVLLFLYLSTNINLREVMRVPVLVEHFYEHKRSTREFNFVGFIVLHYFSGEVQDAGYARHPELPFHDTPSDVTPMSIAITTEDSPVVPHVTEGTIQKLVTHSSPFFSSLAQFIILQPPKA